jgi:hypothetical protein
MALKDVISTATTSTGGSDEEYIASRYDGLNAGPDLTYTFETQTGVQYDGMNGGVFYGWFTSFQVQETADKPFQFSLTTAFEVAHENQAWRTAVSLNSGITF